MTITSESGNPAFLTSQIIYGPGGIGGNPSTHSLNVYTGRTRLTGIDNSTMAAVTFDSYCIDIFDYLSANNATFEVGTFSLSNSTKQSDLRKLLLSSAADIDAASGGTSKQRTAAAIQLAVWEIVNEAGNTPYSLSGGDFHIDGTYGSVNTGGSSSALTLAQGYLDGLGSAIIPAGSRLRTLDAINPINNQRQVFIASVPEPATWSMFILGFGLIGGAMRSRRKAKVSFA